uniref:Uncharacterized protein n=1 Tax=Arundo donax TaxID=35708 RepID=A0A0A9GK58_ARUDO
MTSHAQIRRWLRTPSQLTNHQPASISNNSVQNKHLKLCAFSGLQICSHSMSTAATLLLVTTILECFLSFILHA